MAATDNQKKLGLWVLLVLMFLGIWQVLQPANHPHADLDTFVADAEAGRVASVRVVPDDSGERATLRVQLEDAKVYETSSIALRSAVAAVRDAGVQFAIEPASFSVGVDRLATWLPMLALVGLMWFFFRALRKNTGKAPTDFVRARIEVKPPPERDGPALDTAAARKLVAAVQALKDGTEGPRKILLAGPPGSGKTRLVRQAVAAVDVKWLPLPASDVANMFVGVASARVRRAFELAAAAAPCVLLIEDLDAMASRRSLPGDGTAAHEGQLTEQVQGMIELCQYLDGVYAYPKGVLFVATTNRPDRLDEAVMRPGRIDVRIDLPAPEATNEAEPAPAP